MRRASFVLAAIVAAITITASADARLRVATEVTFDYLCGGGFCPVQFGDDWIYAGQVNSPSRKCSVNRKVRVYEVVLGGGPPILRGSDISDSRGHWFVRQPDRIPSSGDFFAKAPKKRLRNGDVCARDRSPTLD